MMMAICRGNRSAGMSWNRCIWGDYRIAGAELIARATGADFFFDSPVAGGFIVQGAEVIGMLSIGEFSKASGLTIKTLRFYHDQGLLVPAVVDPQSGYR